MAAADIEEENIRRFCNDTTCIAYIGVSTASHTACQSDYLFSRRPDHRNPRVIRQNLLGRDAAGF